MSALDREVGEVSALAREAGRILLEIYRTDFQVELKGVADPVTEADRQANDFLVRQLRTRFPDDGIVAEETDPAERSLGRPRCWYVDPLDGTKEFISRNGEFSVMLGLAIEGEARLGVVYQPTTDKLYVGVVGHGAHLEQGTTRSALRVSSTKKPSDLRLVVSRSHRDSTIDELMRALDISRESASGSVGLKVGLIAEQKADLYVHLSHRSSLWDACGPEAILRAAGGRFTGVNGQAYHYAGSDMRTRLGILACNDAAYMDVLPVVERIAKSVGVPVA